MFLYFIFSLPWEIQQRPSRSEQKEELIKHELVHTYLHQYLGKLQLITQSIRYHIILLYYVFVFLAKVWCLFKVVLH